MANQPASYGPLPVSLRTRIDLVELTRSDPCDRLHCLGSFWPGSRSNFDSAVVKGFKECAPVHLFRPHIDRLCEFYAKEIAARVNDERVDWIARVLGSTETRPEPDRPQGLLVEAVCGRLKARDAAHVFFRTGSRSPMRNVRRMAGPEALRQRIGYAAADLFIKPSNLGGTVLLIDDILNTGASMRVYADALKRFAGAERVLGVNLAATRFKQGHDGRGMLELRTAGLDEHPALRRVWIDKEGCYHASAECGSVRGPASCCMLFLAERRAGPCQTCYPRRGFVRGW